MFTYYFKLSSEYRWMLVAAFFFNLGFYMLIPFLAGYLKQDLLLSATLVGVVLGVRSFCQQGLFLIGGLLADLFGTKTLIMMGCVLRAIGFVLFLFADITPLLFFAAFLTGFAGALFTPAAQAYFAKQETLSRAQMFSLVAVARNGGELLGPVCGLILLNVNFAALCLVSAIPFVIFAIIFAFLLPASQQRKTQPDAQAKMSPSKSIISTVFSNREFLLFCAVMTGYFMLINQISFAIPIHITSQDGEPKDVAWVLTLCALVSICSQFFITRLCERWLYPNQWISIGIALMGLAFVTLIPDWPYNHGVLYYLPLSMLAIVFTLGTMISFPFIMSQISELANNHAVATHFGFFYLFAGIGLVVGSSAIGAAFDYSNQDNHLAWYSLTTIGLFTAVINSILLPSNRSAEEQHSANPLISSVRKNS